MHTKTILIVDDEAGIREVMAQALEDLGGYTRANGYALVQAASGTAELDACEQRAPALIILDFLLRDPAGVRDMTGAEFIQRLRLAGLRSTTRILLCAATTQFAEDYRRYGADDGLAKPFHLDTFLARVAALLDERTTEPRLPALSGGG